MGFVQQERHLALSLLQICSHYHSQYIQVYLYNIFRCFCGNVKDPVSTDWTAHSCGNICGRVGLCGHKCVLRCHPGACPPCPMSVQIHCFCGNTSKFDRCWRHNHTFSCQTGKCGKRLNCGVHYCQEICHPGDCRDCTEKMTVGLSISLIPDCFCGQESRQLECAYDQSGYSCEGVCSRYLSCGVHTCLEKCHPPTCQTCPLHIENLRTCVCGQTPIKELFNARTGVLECLPTCHKICGKPLKCDSNHFCHWMCHSGECPDHCEEGMSRIVCRCGKTVQDVSCREAVESFQCGTVCNTRKDCKRHTCHDKCCNLSTIYIRVVIHYCNEVCGRPLACNNHKCEEKCHSGKCKKCPYLSKWGHLLDTDELFCHCGGTVILPPTPCGTPPPTCSLPCSRPQECTIHPANHDCHPSGDCPPCNRRISATCYGGHKRKSFSCGDKCGKPLKCGIHFCQSTCHQVGHD
ncbi:transcriptional repressor NF-X1 homolog [Octopus sinensis]|uniref:Transcriptional repressor NF-X1 homolog n=1 Tax=Octopus sinensis TaxID=2607531 RepID=A0A7E6EGW5_9MOLL|nr:transcriptional repressor NF-X1 homolog [Octopus sinensis]